MLLWFRMVRSVCGLADFQNAEKQVTHLELPNRKQIRLTQYDYNTPNTYFITICTNNRRNLFWTDVGAIIDRPYNINGSQANERGNLQTSRLSCLTKKLL